MVAGPARAPRCSPWTRRRLVLALPVAALAVLVLAGPLVLAVAAAGALAATPWIGGWTFRAAAGGVVLVGLTPLGYLAGNLGRLGEVTPDLVASNLLPHVLTGAGLALVALSVAVEVLGSRPEVAEAAPSAEAAQGPAAGQSPTVGGER